MQHCAQPKAAESARSQTPRDGNRAAGFASQGSRDAAAEGKTPQNPCWMCILPPSHLRFPPGGAEALRRVIPGSVALTRAGTLTGGDLANRVFGPILGYPLPFGRAVVTSVSAGGDAGQLPCRESVTMPSCYRRLGALKIS